MKEVKESFGLKELVSPLPVQRFIEDHWLANEPVVIQSDLNRFVDFPFLKNLLSLREFAPKYFGRVSMIHKDGSFIDVESGKEAIPYLDQGYTVYFRHIQKYFPEIRQVLRHLAEDLSMPPHQFTAEIFTSSGISGVPFHSDYDLNMSLLLSGESKEWTFSKNRNILNQTGICMPAGQEQIEPKQMDYLIDASLPAEMPSDSITKTLHPGDLIFMPRGWWHTTHSVGECLAVNFVMKGPHWAKLFASAIEKELVSDPAWREYPYWIAARDEKKEIAIDRFKKLIDSFKESLLKESSHDTAERLVNLYIEDF